MKIYPSIFYPGTCKSAIELYTKAFGAKILSLNYVKEAPLPKEITLTNEQKNYILQSKINIYDNVILMQDTINPMELYTGNNINLIVEASIQQIKTAFEFLKIDGKILIPLQKTIFSPCYCQVMDKYLVNWQLIAK